LAQNESVFPEGLVPEDLAAMRDQLLAVGFHVIELAYDRENFGNAIMALERRGLIVRATRDRSQWLLSLFGPWGGAGFDPRLFGLTSTTMILRSSQHLAPTRFALYFSGC
jgi:hypothetical protein